MTVSSKLSELIERIYDAGLDSTLWDSVVVGIRDFVGAQACGLISKNSISKFGVTHHHCGVDPHYIRLYSETYSKFDPLAILPRYGQVVSMPDLVDFDAYRRGRFYQEWLKPQGGSDLANVVLEKSSCPVLMTVMLGDRMVDDEVRRRIAVLVPHATRALTINRALDAKQSEAAAFADTLDGLSAGIFLLDRNCRIVHANTAARRMLDADEFLRAVGGQLSTRNPGANHSLREIFASDDGMALAGDQAIPLNADDGARYVAHVLPLKTLMRGGDAPFKAAGALFVRKAELDSQSGGELVARTFGLTPAELRVLLAIVEVGGVPETAQTLGIAETTVKTHLHRVFAKTGSSRQADLVKLAAGCANPLAN